MFTIKREDIEKGFLLLADQKERGEFWKKVEKEAPNIFQFLSKIPPLIRKYWSEIAKMPDVYRQNQEVINVYNILAFALRPLKAKIGYLPDLNKIEISNIIEICLNHRILVGDIGKKLNQMLVICPQYIRLLIGLIDGCDLNPMAQNLIINFVWAVFQKTKKEYEWLEKNFSN